MPSLKKPSPLASQLANAPQGNTNDLERAAQTVLEALKTLGYQGLSMDFAVLGVCADCTTGAAA